MRSSREPCYGGRVPKSRLTAAASSSANAATAKANMSRRTLPRSLEARAWLLPSLLALLQLAACIHNGPTLPPPTPPAPSGGQTSGPTSCSAGQEWCMGRCIDSISFVNDSANCGRCGNRCSFSETCTGGFCSCGPGYESCMGRCVSSASFISDSSNCGRCGNICMGGESCIGGSCRKL
jgi:hypothetical protein